MNEPERIELWQYNDSRGDFFAVAQYVNFTLVRDDQKRPAVVIIPRDVVTIEKECADYFVKFNGVNHYVRAISATWTGAYWLDLATSEASH